MMTTNNKTEYKNNSRKWRLVLFILLISTLGTFIPPLLSVCVFDTSPLFILTGGHFVTLATLIVSAYFGANVWQKHVLGQASVNISAGVSAKTVTETKKKNENGEA